MTLRFAPPEYPGGRHLLKSGSVTTGAVFPPAVNGDDWVWRLWVSGETSAPNGRARSEQAAKNAILARFRDFLRAAGLEEAE